MMFPQNMLPICQNVYWRKGIRMLEAGGLRFEVGGKKRKTQRKTVDLICFNYLNSTTVI